jgi:lipopolysaccharide/colanic/teichoic acid biosynthesis glycosyltransferase
MGARDAAKRAFDLVVLVLTAPVLLPLIGMVLAVIFVNQAVRREFGPLILRETRITKGKRFPLYKLNMYRESARRDYMENAPKFKEFGSFRFLQDDPNALTLPGRLMKRYYLDELGQVFNVLLGHMSIVGPRPRLENEPISFEPPRQTMKTGVFCFVANRWKTGRNTRLTYTDDEDYLELYQTLPTAKLLWLDLMILRDGFKAIRTGKGL